MNHAEVFRRLWKEKHDWESYGTEPEILWTLRGIQICIKHVHDIKKDMTTQERFRKPRISRWLARDLNRAVEVALHYLKSGNRLRAMSALERVHERVRLKMKLG